MVVRVDDMPHIAKYDVTDISKYIGERVKYIRLATKGSQRELAEHLEITFQQVQKYETGDNRIPSPSLYRIASFYDVTPNFFFEKYLEGNDQLDNQDELDAIIELMIKRPQNLELMKALCHIEDNAMRSSLYDLVKVISAQDKELSAAKSKK